MEVWRDGSLKEISWDKEIFQHFNATMTWPSTNNFLKMHHLTLKWIGLNQIEVWSSKFSLDSWDLNSLKCPAVDKSITEERRHEWNPTRLIYRMFAHWVEEQWTSASPHELSKIKLAEWSTLIGPDCRGLALIGRELYRTEIFLWCCSAGSLMP